MKKTTNYFKVLALVYENISKIIDDINSQINYCQKEHDDLFDRKMDPEQELSRWEEEEMERYLDKIQAYEKVIEYLSKYTS